MKRLKELLSESGFPLKEDNFTVQQYVIDKYGKDVLDEIAEDLEDSMNTWDYFVTFAEKDKDEIDRFVKNYL